jgi:hypothetical protein
MFTFLRLSSNNSIIKNQQKKSEDTQSAKSAHKAAEPGYHEKAIPLNPWAVELDRLQAKAKEAKLFVTNTFKARGTANNTNTGDTNTGNTNTDSPHMTQSRRFRATATRAALHKMQAKQGTMTNLQNWWGNAIHSRQDPNLSKNNIPKQTAKRQNHWFQ